jgi:hypothetical protein
MLLRAALHHPQLELVALNDLTDVAEAAALVARHLRQGACGNAGS